jgi:hypothetical protein
MNRACLMLLSVSCVSCANIHETAADITTISLGSDQLQTVQIDESVKLADAPLLACVPIQLPLKERNATVALQPSAAGCALTVHQPDLVLFDQDEIKQARKRAGPFDVDGIRGGSVSLIKLELTSGEGEALPLSQYVDAISIKLDGAMLLDKLQPEMLQAEPLKRRLPEQLIAKLKSSIKNNQPATVDVVLTLWLQPQAIQNVPTSLNVSLELQPELEVSLIDAL